MVEKRIQLTLFVDEGERAGIEMVRRKYNPVQHGLIGAHVTLCREDELKDLERIMKNLRELRLEPVVIGFDKVVRFSEGKGVLLPAADDRMFQQLRQRVLRGVIDVPRRHEPHITLMHPRNSECSDQMFSEILGMQLPQNLVFRDVSLIEQESGGPWKVLERFIYSA